MKSFLSRAFALLLLFLPSVIAAQSSVIVSSQAMQLRIGGSLQSRVSFLSNPNLTTSPESQMGIGIRRARIRLFGNLRPNVRLFMQLEGTGTTPFFNDLRAEWDITPETMLRFGRFVGAQPRGMALTVMYEMDAIDRAAILEHWARSTLGADARSFGVEMVRRKGDVELRGFVHSGDNSQNFRSGISDTSPNGGDRRGAIATAAMVRVFPSSLPHSEIGAHVGHNPTKSANAGNRSYSDWSAHAYWGDKIGSQPTRLKFDAMGIRFDSPGPVEQTTMGLSLLAAQLIRPDTELFARLERLDTTFNEFGYVTAGATYKLWDWTNKVTAAWSLRTDLKSDSDPVHIFTVQSQFHF